MLNECLHLWELSQRTTGQNRKLLGNTKLQIETQKISRYYYQTHHNIYVYCVLKAPKIFMLKIFRL